MKVHSTIAAIALLFGTWPAQAQWQFGAVLDFNVASIYVDPVPSSEEYSSRLGFGVGAVLDRPLFNQFDLHAEPMFLQKGAKIEERGEEIALKITYLEIPVMLRYTFQTGTPAQPYAMAGPSLGIMLGGKFDVKNGPEYGAGEEVKTFDLGLALGGGVRMPQGNTTVFAEARYVLGLPNINDEAGAVGESTVKNRGFQIVLGIMLPPN